MAAPLTVITGATHGIGRALALAFGREGHPLLLIARHAETIQELAGHPHRFAAADVTDYAALAAAIGEAEAQFGPVDCLINNAGFIHIGDFSKRAVDDLDYETDVLLKGVLHGVRAVLPGMIERKRGTIVNVSSIAALGTGLPGNAFYAASKAEVAILTKRFAMELGAHNITVNAVAPGFVRTDLTQGGRGAPDWQATEQRFAAKAMMGRIGEPDDIANAIAFLAAPESGWITAQVLTVDGGRMDYIGHG